MALLIITAKPAFLPDPDDLAGWTQEGGLYHLQAGAHHLFATGCISEVSKKQRAKHEQIAQSVREALALADTPAEGRYLIVHDKDLLKAGGGDEGIYPESGAVQVGSSLAGLIPDGHIYIFQHVPRQDMFETLISRLLDGITEADVEQAIQLINSCTYETPIG